MIWSSLADGYESWQSWQHVTWHRKSLDVAGSNLANASVYVFTCTHRMDRWTSGR